jgi:hypothetical protein
MELDGKSLIGARGAKQVGVQVCAYAVGRKSGDIYAFFVQDDRRQRRHRGGCLFRYGAEVLRLGRE